MKPRLIDPERVRAWLRVLWSPSYWLQNEPYSAAWDAALRELMGHHRFERHTFATAKLGPVTIWTANHPYGSMMPWDADGPASYRPSRATIMLAHEKLVRGTCVPPCPIETEINRFLSDGGSDE